MNALCLSDFRYLKLDNLCIFCSVIAACFLNAQFSPMSCALSNLMMKIFKLFKYSVCDEETKEEPI